MSYQGSYTVVVLGVWRQSGQVSAAKQSRVNVGVLSSEPSTDGVCSVCVELASRQRCGVGAARCAKLRRKYTIKISADRESG